MDKKILNKVLTIIFILITAGALFLTVSNAVVRDWGSNPNNISVGEVNVGDYVTIGREWAKNHKDFFCVYHDQSLDENRRFKSIAKISIVGNTATDHTGKSIDHNYNGILAYELNLTDGKGGFARAILGEQNRAQTQIYRDMAEWISNVGKNFSGIYEGFAQHYIGGYYDNDKRQAIEYAESLSRNALTNQTQRDSIKAEAYTKNGESYLKIGPFKYEFREKLESIELSDKSGKTITPSAYGIYNGSELREVNLSDINSGSQFYVIIPSNSGLAMINKIKVTETHRVKSADIVFWEYTQNSRSSHQQQNVIQFTVSEKPQTVNDEWNDVDIPLLIDLSGFVWEDVSGGKDNTYATYGADIYAEGDILLEGITVRIVDQNGNVIKNNKGEEAVTKTDSKGKYKFTDLYISELKNYTVEFEYDGLKYTSVKPLVGNDSKVNSKAGEIVEKRKELNAAFTEITNNSDDIADRSQGNTRNASGSVTGKLTYNNDAENWSSKYEDTTYNKNLIANTAVTNYSLSEQFAKGNYITNDNGSIEIPNINLGVLEREQPQMSISNDIEKVNVKLNGYDHTYLYGQRNKYVEDNNAFNVGVKFGQEYVSGYTRAIYPSDIQYSATDATDSNRLKVSVTYVATIRNLSNSLTMSLNELVNYYDTRYTIVNSWIDDENNKITWSDTSKYGQNYNDGKFKSSYTTGLAGTKINAGENKKVYIEFQVSDAAVLDLLNNKATLDNIVEVFSYSTYYGKDAEGCKAGDIYAGIDKVSAPGNAKMELDASGKLIKTTYEADTDSAPSLVLEAKGARTIEGNVFEDETSNELQTNNERKGDGIYNKDKENVISGVKVELLNSDYTVATIYPNAADANGNPVANTQGVKAEATTGADGYYVFRGIEPGEYYIRYTYTNGTTKVFDTKGKEVKDITVQDYKSTIITSDTIKQAFEDNEKHLTWYKENGTRYSEARDDYNQRKAIDNEIKAIDDTTKTSNNSINANSPRFDLGIEYESVYSASTGDYYEYKVSDIDFGIVERPRQSANLDKVISNIKVTLPNGQVLVDGNPQNKLDYVTVTGDNVYITMDSELIYGSHIEIKYDLVLTNSSEKDYISENYYYYGIPEGEIVKFDRATLIDYVDREITLKAGENNNWTVIGNAEELANKGFNWNLTSEQEEQLLKNFNTIVKAEPVSDTDQLEPGQSKSSTIIVEKLLSTDDKELSYENNGEVVTIGKNGGSTMTTKLGSFAPRLAENVKEQPVEPDEDKALTVNIIPPTGATNNNVMYAIIGVVSLAILGAGTYGVRRFLKK